MKKALVTGGLGFIGSHLVDSLLEEGWEVIVLDNLLTGRKSNLERQRRNQSLKVTVGDIRRKETAAKATKDCDAVFHLAAHALMRVSQADPAADIDYNLMGTMNVLQGAVRNEVPDFVFASTSALYGEAAVFPTPEYYSGVQTSFYGASKLAGEAFAAAMVQFASMRLWAFRFGTVLGERCRRGAIWDFEHKLLKNPHRLEILGDGKQTKDYLSVSDCVGGILLGHEKARDPVNIFNIGLAEKTTVDEVADIVIKEMGLKDVKKTYTGGSHGWKGDNPVVNLSFEKIKKLGWRPRFTASQAITTTARWTLKEIQR